MKSPALLKLLIFVLLLSASGCTYANLSEGQIAFGYAWWVPTSIFIVAAIAVFIGWKIREKTEAAGYITMLIAGVVALFLAPSLALNYTVVDGNGFRMRGGLLGMSSYRANYAETRHIKYTYQDTHTRRSGTIRKFYLDCDMTDGSKQSIELSSVGAELAGAAFVQLAKLKGVSITDETVPQERGFGT